ncbi:hypothetical protein RB595_009447 [Gaeumannomyces hyphopodioides]
MPYPQAQGLGHTAQAGGAGDHRSQTNSSMSGKTVCPYEEHVVTDPNVSRIVLMIMRDFVNRKALYDYAEDEGTMFRCPIMRCYEEFDQPIGLIGHLLECKQLKFGEFNCLRCKNCHRYPITEREWREWEGWQAEAPATGIKQRLSEFSDSFLRAIRSQRRSNAPSSHGGSPSAATNSTGPPDWKWSETWHPTLHEGVGLGPMPDQEKSEYREVVAPIELSDTSSSRYRQSSSSSFVSGQNSSSRSGSSSQPTFDMSGSYWGSSTSSLDSSQATAPELQIHTSPVRYFGNLTQSPDGMHLVQAGGQPVWGPTSTPGYANEAAPRTNAFVPTPDSRGIAAGCFPIPAINGSLASHQINSWNPRDDSQFSCLQQQMSPPPLVLPLELHADLIEWLRDTPAANSGALDPCLEISGQITVYEPPNQTAAYELADQAVCELSDQSVACELSGQGVACELYGHVPARGPDCEGRPSDYTCEMCPWQPEKDGKPANFANYLRKHRQTHLGRKFYCQNLGCKRSYSRADNLSKHVKESHPGSTGAHGSPSSCQTRSANKRRFTNGSAR